GGRRLREGPAELADGSARRADDDDVFHVCLLVQSLPDVAAGRRLDRLVLDTPRAPRCRALAAFVLREPFAPYRPPAAGDFFCRFHPSFRIFREGISFKT